MNEKGNRYAISALRDKRATIASEIKALEKSVRHKREQLVHVDAFLALLDPSGDPESIPLKRMVSNINLFRSGELSRLVMTAFREADGEALPTKGIVEAVMRGHGVGEEACAAITSRVRGSLAYQQKRGNLVKIEDREKARPRLVHA